MDNNERIRTTIYLGWNKKHFADTARPYSKYKSGSKRTAGKETIKKDLDLMAIIMRRTNELAKKK